MPNDVIDAQSVTMKPIVLNSRQSKFLASYQLTGNATESAINAGYSAKTAHIEGYRLLKHPKILAELNAWKDKKRTEQLSREDFIDLAVNDYKALDKEQPNKPRFLDIAGKALGYLGANGSQHSVVNNTQINIGEIKLIPKDQKWKLLRDALESE